MQHLSRHCQQGETITCQSFFGIVSILVGIAIYIQPVFYSSKYNAVMDYSNIKGPFAVLCVFVGLALIWAYWKDNKLKKTKEKVNRKCRPDERSLRGPNPFCSSSAGETSSRKGRPWRSGGGRSQPGRPRSWPWSLKMSPGSRSAKEPTRRKGVKRLLLSPFGPRARPPAQLARLARAPNSLFTVHRV